MQNEEEAKEAAQQPEAEKKVEAEGEAQFQAQPAAVSVTPDFPLKAWHPALNAVPVHPEF